MFTLYVIRHGETEWNVEKRMQGRLDSNLTEKGIQDARLLGERLKDTEFQQVIASPSPRTLKTAKLVIGDREIPVRTDERLMEIDLGKWQGLTEIEIKQKFPDQIDAYYNQPAQYRSLGGEDLIDVKQRMNDFLIDLANENPSGNILLVTHGVAIKTLYLVCRNAGIDEIWSPPWIHGTSLTMIKVNGDEKELLMEGCTAHCVK